MDYLVDGVIAPAFALVCGPADYGADRPVRTRFVVSHDVVYEKDLGSKTLRRPSARCGGTTRQVIGPPSRRRVTAGLSVPNSPEDYRART